jgi:tryptophan synthase alpha chain
MTTTNPTAVESCIRSAQAAGRAALMPFCVAGVPSREDFGSTLLDIAQHADLIEIGLPFSDPVADGPVIAELSRERARAGITLQWLLECIAELPEKLSAPPILFSYLNPLLAFGLDRLVDELSATGFVGLLVPDLPFEESAALRAKCAERGIALIQLVTPLTTAPRLSFIAEASTGFIYAVLRSGITGCPTQVQGSIEFLRRVQAATRLPVCAGFGLGSPDQIEQLRTEVDGLIIGTALVQHLNLGLPAGEFLAPLFRATTITNQ